MTRRIVPAALLALSLVLSGCAAISISTGERDSGPVQVGVGDGLQKDSGSGPTTPPVPDGMTSVSVQLGASCPVTVELAMDGTWTDGGGMDGFHLYERDSGAVLNINCVEDSEDSAQAIVDSTRNYTFNDPGSSTKGEKTGTVGSASYWSFHGTLGPTAIRAIDQRETSLFGAVAGLQEDGRLYKVSVEMLAPIEDAKTIDQFELMLPTVAIGGARLDSPQFS